MKLQGRLLFTILLLVPSALLSCPQASAQFSKLDELTAQIANKLKGEKPHMVAVVEFTAPDGSPSSQGDYFAWFVVSALKYHAKKLPVADREAFKSALAKAEISPRDLNSPETLVKLAAQVHIDFITTGTVETAPDSYTIHVTTRRLTNASKLIDKTTVIHRTEFTDSLSEPFPPKTDYPVVNTIGPGGTVDKSHIPVCVHCPPPSYNDEARRDKIQGTSIFEVLVSPTGEVVKAHPTKLLGYGLDQEGFETIKRWRLRPALGPDGKPIAVIVSIEVSFRLY
jgi:hypothetical protein